MADFIVTVILAALVIGALWIIRSNRKKGKSCAGCPYAASCNSRGECGRK